MKLVIFFILAAALPLSAQDKTKIDRGRYLAENVGQCQTCHAQRMKGTELAVAPIKEIKGWHKTSPDITPTGKTWERWGEEALVKFLMTGLGPRGTPADPPMPMYKLNREDAEAVVAYLKSLK